MKRDYFTMLGKNRTLFGLMTVVGILFSAVSVAMPLISGHLINCAVSDLNGSVPLLLVYLVCGLLQICISLLDHYGDALLTLRQKQLMRKNAFTSFYPVAGESVRTFLPLSPLSTMIFPVLPSNTSKARWISSNVSVSCCSLP